MNEQLQTALAEILSRATSGIDAGAQFLSAQLPDVIRQLLVWKLAQNALMIPFLCLGIWGLVKLLLAIHRAKDIGLWRRQPEWSWEKGTMPMTAIAYVAAVASMLVGAALAVKTVNHLFTAAQIWLAPKIYLIEYAASLAK